MVWDPKKGVIYSAYVSENTDVLNRVLWLYADPGCSVLDATFNTGKFWRRVDFPCELATNDLDPSMGDMHFDFRHTEFDDECFDVEILDPPYAVKATGARGSAARDGRYDGARPLMVSSRDNVEMYMEGAIEAHRILKKRGILILKVQDEIDSQKFYAKHVPLMEVPGFLLEDLFITVNPGKPIWDPKWKNQLHARKNHSYFIVHRKV